jgi:hypothetical protein
MSPPYTKVSNHIALWLSGKNYWDEALKLFQQRYDYSDEYMANNREAIINAHTLPLEMDSYISPLAQKEAWYDHNNQQTGWFYTIPGHLTDGKKNTTLRGLFTWGIAFDGKCLHRSFTLRKDRELLKAMKDNEYTKKLYENSLSHEQKEHKELSLHTSHGPIIIKQDAWDVKIHDEERRLFYYLSQYIYKMRQKGLLEK